MMNEILDWILNTVESVDPVLRTLLAGLGIMLETSVLIGLVVPGDTIVLVASTAVDGVGEYFALDVHGHRRARSSARASASASDDGSARTSCIRASAARIGEDNWHRAQLYLDRRGGPAIFISRFLPVLHSLIPLTVGMSTMRYRRFIAWTVPACVIWAFAYVTVGWLAAGSYRELSRSLHWAGYVFVGIIAVFLLAVWGVKKLLVRSEAKHMAAIDEIGRPEADDAADDDVSYGRPRRRRHRRRRRRVGCRGIRPFEPRRGALEERLLGEPVGRDLLGRLLLVDAERVERDEVFGGERGAHRVDDLGDLVGDLLAHDRAPRSTRGRAPRGLRASRGRSRRSPGWR